MRPVKVVALCALLWALAPRAAAEEPTAPDATQVIVRSKKTFEQALEAALHPLLAEQPARPVFLVLDVSPNVRKHGSTIRDALAALDGRHAEVASWQFALLGAKAAKPLPSAAALGAAVAAALDKDTAERSTVGALAETLKRSRVRGAAVVYVNDWRFEDDARLEDFLKALARAGNALSVVGTEAAFGRAWTDGWVKEDDRFDMDNPMGFEIRDYHEGIGRSPFAKGDHDAPWHGGDCAYPHAPYRWHTFLWSHEFTEHDFESAADTGPDLGSLFDEDGKVKDPEELARRLKEEAEKGKLGGEPDDAGPSEDANRYFPIPAAYGPYGLMRAAGVSGGRYVLWSWNPGGRRQVHYEYPRCNLFPPDLRPRKDILRSMKKNVLAGAMIKAWCELEAAAGNVIDHNAPLKANLRTPRSIDRFAPGAVQTMDLSWDTKGEWRGFQRAAERALAALGKAAHILDAALAQAPETPRDAVERRYRADAELFRHAVRVMHLAIAEGLHTSRKLPRNAWSNAPKIPGVGGRAWIPSGHDPEKVRTRGEVPADNELGAAVRAERKRLLARYRGTPVAEIIGLNDVELLRFAWWQKGGEMPDIGRSPSESTGDPKPGAPGAPSTGGGPTTGK